MPAVLSFSHSCRRPPPKAARRLGALIYDLRFLHVIIWN